MHRSSIQIRWALILLIGSSFSHPLPAQGEVVADTVAQARMLAYADDFAGADRLLSIFNNQNPCFESLHLHGQVLYWMKDFNRAADVYERAIAAYPEAPEVRLDYGRLLFAMKRWNRARPLLEDYLAADSLHAEANVLLAWIYHWNGYERLAARRANLALKNQPGDEGAVAVLREIEYFTAPFFRTNMGYASDDQPVDLFSLQFEAGGYTSRLLAPALRVSFDEGWLAGSSFSASWIQASNRFLFGRTATKLELAGGLFNPDTGDDWSLTGRIGLRQKIASPLSLDVYLARTPYRNTRASLGKTVMQGSIGAAVDLATPGGWMGRAAYNRLEFAGSNTVRQANAWLLAPLLRLPALAVNGGYSFAFADATNSTFTPLQPPESAPDPATAIEGFYDPNFTPENQQVHALLASVKIAPSKHIELSFKAEAGFLARADNPYFFPAAAPGGGTYLETGFYRQSFRPFEGQARVRLQLSRQVALSGNYSYSKLFFYRRSQVGLELHYHFTK